MIEHCQKVRVYAPYGYFKMIYRYNCQKQAEIIMILVKMLKNIGKKIKGRSSPGI